jgi:hypothetical protein
VKRIPAWLTYTLLRLLFIAVPLAVLLLILPADLWIVSAVAAVVIGFCLSYLFLRTSRQAVADQLAAANKRDRRKAAPAKDDEVEDAAVDAAEASDPAPKSK